MDRLTTALLEDEHNIYHDPLLPLQSPTIPLPSIPSPRNEPIAKLAKYCHQTRQVTMSLHSDDESQETAPTTVSIAPLQDIDTAEGKQGYDPIKFDDPRSFDLVEPGTNQEVTYSLEQRADLLFSNSHLEAIFQDARLFLKFTTFLSKHRPNSVPLLIYYLDSVKALKAIAYSNAILDGLEPVSFADFTAAPPKVSANKSLQEKSNQAFAVLTQEDLPAYITHVFVDIVSSSIQRKITGTMAPQLLQASEGLAEVFCMSDVSKPDNPIVFSSEEFHRTTQYGLNYALGRNCRFLQGPKTDPFSVRRLRDAVRNGQECQETFLNYRRDGSPFMNLLTVAPLLDNQGRVRYFIGAQVDVSGLVKDSTNLEALAKLIAEQESRPDDNSQVRSSKEKKDEFQSLSEMFNQSELETVRVHGGRMHSEQHDIDDTASVRASNRPRLLIREPSGDEIYDGSIQDNPVSSTKSPSPAPGGPMAGRLPGVFANYLIVRPYPSLRITFTSPSLRVPGTLQSPFLSRIGGTPRVREELTLAMSEGRNVTAKIRWLNASYDDLQDGDDYASGNSAQAGKARWIHCTPLLGPTRTVGAWMIIMIDGEDYEQGRAVQTERTGVVSPSWGRHSNNNSVTTGSKSRNPSTRRGQHLWDGPHSGQQSAVDANEWDLDFDIASASMPHQSSRTMPGASTSQKARSQSSALSTSATPRPTVAVPPVPVQNYSQSYNTNAPRDIARQFNTRSNNNSPANLPMPLSSHNLRQTKHQPASSPHNNQITSPIEGSFRRLNIPQVPPTQEKSQLSATSGPLPQQPATLPSAQSQTQPQSRSQPRTNNAHEQSPHLTSKMSIDNLSKKQHTSFGHRVLHGFRRDKDKDKDKAPTTEHMRPQTQQTEQTQARNPQTQTAAPIHAQMTQVQTQAQAEVAALRAHANSSPLRTVRESAGSGYTMT